MASDRSRRRSADDSVLGVRQPPDTVCRSAGVLEVSVSALTTVRSLPVRVAARMTTAGDPDRPGDAGMTTAEYAVGTVAACGFSGVLYKVITSPQVLELVTSVLSRAFRLAF